MSALVDHRSDPGDPARSRGSWPEGTGPKKAPSSQPEQAAEAEETSAAAARVEVESKKAGSRAEVEQDTARPVGRKRTDFGRHLEAHYPRLVAQLYAITLDAGHAHDLVQDAYARAWRTWPEIVRNGDPTDWVRRVAVSQSMRSWSSMVGRIVRRHPTELESMGPRGTALARALQQLSPAERRAVVLHHTVGMSVADIAALEHKPAHRVEARLARGRLAVIRGHEGTAAAAFNKFDLEEMDDES